MKLTVLQMLEDRVSEEKSGVISLFRTDCSVQMGGVLIVHFQALIKMIRRKVGQTYMKMSK